MTGKKHKGSAGNRRIKYTDKNYNLTEKYSIPPKLCIEILNQIKENSQAEIAILEQAIAEIKKQRQEILEKIDKFDFDPYLNEQEKVEVRFLLKEELQLNQPKTE